MAAADQPGLEQVAALLRPIRDRAACTSLQLRQVLRAAMLPATPAERLHPALHVVLALGCNTLLIAG